ncbi:mitotic cyclin [Trypanosoma conorhini]|uniref:Mitotic cyclin n=1 Tax=Trypanosoma conorhini TaxID=83891 RepID=A0A422QBC7_9TRYP|nr:mitotic cyclin [Trypanosoma conorhini]RNF27257.1 mitotic cyclin [Trypanosoma conorhini]
MNFNSNDGSHSLQLIDINQGHFKRDTTSQFSRAQPVPSNKAGPLSVLPTEGGTEAIFAKLSYDELRICLQEALSRVELLCSNSTEERLQLLQNEFSRLIAASSDETKRVLRVIRSDTPLSYRVLEVLRLRRRELCTGFEYSLGDLQEWLSLAVLLGEPDAFQFAKQYIQWLGPCSRKELEDVFSVNASNVESLWPALLGVRAPVDYLVSFDFRYYSLMLDDLIAVADEPPQAASIQSLQSEMTLSTREVLAQWLLNFTVALKLRLETFFLAVAMVDLYLCRVPVRRERLHLLGSAALLLASKQEEIFPAPLQTLVRHGNGRFTLDTLVVTECKLFQHIGFDVVIPTLSAVGMGLFMPQDPPPCEAQRSCLLYILATLAIRTHYRQYRLSSLAAAAVYLSRVCFNIPTGRACEEVVPLLPLIEADLSRNSAVGAGSIHDIFSKTTYHNVSRLPLSEMIRAGLQEAK